MKINIICNIDTLAVGTILHLQEHGQLGKVYLLDKNLNLLKPSLTSSGVKPENITLLSSADWKMQLTESLTIQPVDMVWVFGFPWVIPTTVCQIPRLGFFNFHYGAFPDYKGADPIFWQIRNQDSAAGLVVHQLTEELDGGPVVYNENIPIVPGENNAMYSLRAGFTTPGLIPKIFAAIEAGNYIPQTQSEPGPYFKRPSHEQRCINWAEQDADEIEALINACNPYYGGASTFLRGQEIKILEVSPVDLNDNNQSGVEPGTIVYADAVYGVIVACKQQQFLRINILSAREGYLSGIRLFALGIKGGDRFYHPLEQIIKNEHQQESVPS